MNREKKAFTLIELLIVIAIIGILATIVVVNVGKAKVRSEDTKIKTDITTVARAVDMYFMNKNFCPSYVTSKGGNTSPISDEEIASFVDDSNNPILSKAPVHPKQSGAGTCTGPNKVNSYCSGYYFTGAVSSSYTIQYYIDDGKVYKSCSWNMGWNIPLTKTCQIF